MKVVERKWNVNQQRLVITKSSYNWQPALIKRVAFLTPDNQGFVFVGGGKSCDLASKKPTGNDSDKYIRSRIQRFIPPKTQQDAAIVAHYP